MSDYKVLSHYGDNGKRLEDVLIEYFSIYLDNGNYD